jgi:hypothetical protein
MKANHIVLSMMLVASVTVLFSGCKKENDKTTGKNSANMATDNNLSEQAYASLSTLTDQIMSSGKKSLKSGGIDTVYQGQCILATLNYTAVPFVLTIDFGTSNCLCTDGKYRRGTVTVTFNGDYFSQGTVITYALQDYYENDNHVMGTLTITNMGRNTSGNLYWSVHVAGQIEKANNGGTITWNSDREHEWSEGESTPMIWWDDVYLVRGTASGTTAEGLSYTLATVSDLEKKANCQWISAGILDFQPDNWPLFVVDYGTGTCDNQATVTVNGVVYNITV